MSVFAFFIFFLQFPVGFLLTSYFDKEKRLTYAESFFATLILGPTTTCFILLCFLLILGSWKISIFCLWISLVACLFYAFSKLRADKITKFNFPYLNFHFLSSLSFWVMLILFCLYSGILFGGFLLNEEGFPAVISLGWADTSYHLSMIGRLTMADPFILEHPVISGQPINYPFMLNLLTALYQQIGFSLFSAWHLSNALYGVSFFFLIYLFGKRFLHSEVLAALLVALVFFGGGIGFLLYFSDLSLAWGNDGFNLLINSIFNPPHEYTHLQYRDAGRDPSEYGIFHNIYWIVPAISFLSHQRTFLPGIALATLLFIGLTAYRGNKNIWRWAFVWGSIPLFHSHSFIASSIVLLSWFFLDLKNYRSWFIGGLIGALLVIPQILYMTPSNLSDDFSFLRPWLGWMMCTHNSSWLECDNGVRGIDTNIFWFWTKNFGIVIWGWFAAVFFFFLYKKTNITKLFKQSSLIIIPSLLLFLIPNLVLLQPWEFDNNKILFYWWIFASVSTLIVTKNLFKNRRIAIATFTFVIILSTFSGIVDVASRITKITANHYGYYNKEDVKIAEWIKQNTIPNARFLTGDFVDQFVPIITGRPIYLGYPGWLWSQGKASLSNERKKNATDFLLTGQSDTMCKDGVSYVVWDRRLLTTYPRANKDKVLTSAKVVYSENGSEVLEILCKK